MLTEKIIELISQGGLLTVGALAIYLVFKFFNNMIDYKYKTSSPLNHPFFYDIDYYLYQKIPTLKLYNKDGDLDMGRTEIFKDMLMIKLKVWKEKVREFVSYTGEAVGQKAIDTVNEIIKTYNQQRCDAGIPMQVIMKFNERHMEHADTLMSAIHKIFLSRSFSNADEQKNGILHLHNAMLVMTVLDAEKALGDLNGKLSGIEYKGHKLL